MIVPRPSQEQQQAPAYSEVVLLLGAGASREAGAPTVTELVDGFEGFLAKAKSPELLRTYQDLHAILNAFEPIASRRAIVDVELLMTAITMLTERSDNPLSAFIHNWKSFVRQNESRLPELLDALQEHIRRECTVSAGSVDYLRPIGDFIRQFGRLDIFTLNYDAAIEIILQKEEYSYTDGFDVYWNPALLDSTAYQARLFKLHGSLLWFVTSGQPRRLAKIPVRTAAALPEFFSEEEVSHNVIYPVLTKEQHVEPYATLMNHFRQALSSARLLVAIGCSFRDTYLKQVVIERMLQNRALRLAIVDPCAGEVIEHSDEMLDPQWTFGSVSNRVSVLPLEAASALSGRVLLDRTLRLAELQRLQDNHIGAVLQGGGEGPTDSYVGRLIALRLLSEFCSACEHRSSGEALQERTVQLLPAVDSPNTNFSRWAPFAVYIARHSPDPGQRRTAGEWLASGIQRLAQHVCHGRFIFLGNGRKLISLDAGQRYVEERHAELSEEAEELSACISFMSTGVPNDVVAKSRALLASLEAFRDYFSAMVAALPQVRFFHNDERTIQAPRPADADLVAKMSGYFDDEREPAVIGHILS